MNTTYEVPKGLNKENWKKEHLNRKHDKNYFAWCALCMAKKEGLKNDVKGNVLDVIVSEKVNSIDKFGR